MDLEALEKEIAKFMNENPSFSGWTPDQELWLRDMFRSQTWAIEPARALAAAPRFYDLLPSLLCELRAWRSQQGPLKTLIEKWRDSQADPFDGGFEFGERTARSECADELAAILALPQEATPEDDRTKIKS